MTHNQDRLALRFLAIVALCFVVFNLYRYEHRPIDPVIQGEPTVTPTPEPVFEYHPTSTPDPKWDWCYRHNTNNKRCEYFCKHIADCKE